MKIQELIDQLTKAKEQHGDLEVLHSGCCGCSADADGLNIDASRGMVWIINTDDLEKGR